MATNIGFSQHDSFNGLEFDKWHNPCPFKLNNFISMHSIERLDQHICFTNCNLSVFVDKFWEVCQVIETWQMNMKDLFSTSWVVCLN
jgi:hypothetical protein